MASDDLFSNGAVGLEKAPVKNRCQVDIFGRKYTLVSTANEAYAKELAFFVETKMKELAGNAKGIDLAKLAIVSAINIAYEMFELKKQREEDDAVLDKRAGDLIEYIEDQFEEFRPV